MAKYLLLFTGILLLACQTSDQDIDCTEYPKPNGYVNDFEHVLTDLEVNRLEKKLTKFETKTSHEVALVTVASYTPDTTLFDFSVNLANCWGVGKLDSNNGVLIAFSKTNREARIQVGKGIENRITDSEAQKIIDEKMLPNFKSGKYCKGLEQGIDQIFNELE